MVTLTPKILNLKLDFWQPILALNLRQLTYGRSEGGCVWKEIKNITPMDHKRSNFTWNPFQVGEQFIFSHLIFIYTIHKHYYPTSVQIKHS